MTFDEILGLGAAFEPVEIGARRYEVGLSRHADNRELVAARLEVSERGEIQSIVELAFGVEDLRVVDGARGLVFAAGCALAARRIIERSVAAGEAPDAILPDAFFLPGLVRRADLVSAEQFAAALLDHEGVRLEVELEDFVRGLRRTHAAAADCLRDAADVRLADALLNLFTRRYTHAGSRRALARIGGEERKHLAPLLIAYLDISVDSINHRFDGTSVTNERQAKAFELLSAWQELPPDGATRWANLR